MESPKERDAWLKAQRAPRPQQDQTYDARHGNVRLAAWWLCPRCSTQVAPFERHRHLR